MKIVNKTGVANDTKVFNSEGKDVTDDLNIKEIVISVGKTVTAIIHCAHVELDLDNVQVEKK